MSVLVAFVREAQPGRVAEVRRALQEHALVATRRFPGIRVYQVLQGRAQSNLYIDLVEWESYRAFENARDPLRLAATEIRHLFLRPAHVRVYRPVEVVRLQRREPHAVGVGLVRVRPGAEEEYARRMRELLTTRFRERPGLLAAGLYQGEHEPQQFLVRSAWATEDHMLAHRTWITQEVFPATDALVARRELLSLLTRWHYRQAELASGAPT
jgi:quinol monooxygenase YgiN